MSVEADGTVREERKATPIGTVSAVPPGTMICAPSAPPSGGSGEHPIVAVDTTHWYKDPQFMAAAIGAILAVADPVVEYLTMPGPIRWRSLVLACILAIVAWLRKQTNTTVR